MTLQHAPETHTFFDTRSAFRSHTFWRNRIFGRRKLTERDGIRPGNPTFVDTREGGKVLAGRNPTSPSLRYVGTTPFRKAERTIDA